MLGLQGNWVKEVLPVPNGQYGLGVDHEIDKLMTRMI
jgi:hypothetical protein